ncbi:TVP38/TMEM64 family protein [Nostocaceae cyanobacterium CENA357]|uniref:TVP38/TMEM64 family membrane protein n=1 Tax=Atlanticothrix silvestris CENA357 TaxID=1725252 RepID=A0A8J7HLL0_9CYAN|nr:TVP38/TMEM64 family protein [Atlanticothrix silvestris]MBH8555033.1 TVP38/TMEM64 family protein [Atlanticothrix silvestris CENA357]
MLTKHKPRFKGKLKLLLLSLLVATLIIAARHSNVQEILSTSIIWVNSLGALGPIAYIVIYNLATLLFIPGSLLTLKGGCLFGLLWGSVYVLIAAIIGATLAFLIGRYLSREWVAQQIDKHPKFKAIDLAVAKGGWKIVLLTRLCPLFPFNLLNYAFGVTQVSLKDYMLGSFGIVPGTVMYTYIGSLAGNLAMINTSNQPTNPQAEIWQWVMQGVGLIAAVAVTIYMTKIARQALAQSVATVDNNNDQAQNH